MAKLKFLILFIFFIQVVPNFVDLLEKELDGLLVNKCTGSGGNYLNIETSAQCVERNAFLPKEDDGSKCCFYSAKIDPILSYKKKYGENWKKIYAENKGYDLNISEEEIRKKIMENIKESNYCEYIMKGSNNTMLYGSSLTAIDGIVKYDCGEGQKIFNKTEFHPTSKEDILDKQLVDSYILPFTEKDCLKSGAKLSDDNYQICWCEKILLSSEGINIKYCLPYRISTFQERLTKEMIHLQKNDVKYENKCTCSSNKGKTTKGSFNSVTGEVKVEIN
jgi:hypothetical protein